MNDETKDGNGNEEKPQLKDLSDFKSKNSFNIFSGTEKESVVSLASKREEKKKELKTTKYDFTIENENYPDKKLTFHLTTDYCDTGIDIEYYFLVEPPTGMKQLLESISNIPGATGPKMQGGKIRQVCEGEHVELNKFEKFLYAIGIGKSLEDKAIIRIIKLQRYMKKRIAHSHAIREKEEEFKKKLQ